MFDELFLLLSIEDQLGMKNSVQDRIFHSEGSTYNHSKMVASYLDSNNINFQLCALFHDISKKDVVEAREKIDRIRIMNIEHEYKSLNYIEKYKSIYDSKYDNIDWDFIKEVCVYHMRMHDYNSHKISKPNKRKFMEELKYFEELKVFSKADELGRIEDTTIAPPYLIITVSPPGGGKSTWAKSFSEKSGYSIICPDEIRKELTGNISDQSKNNEVWETAYHRLKEKLNNKECVIFDSCACNTRTVKTLKTIAKNCSAIPIFKIFIVNKEVCKERIKNDLINNVVRSNVPDEIVDKMAIGFEEVVKYLEENKNLTIKE